MNIDQFVQNLGIHPGDVDRIILHWTGGGPKPAAIDIKSYHVLVDQTPALHQGMFTVDDNIDTADRVYAMHTLHANTRAIGISLCGMHGAIEGQTLGDYPFTEEQFRLAAIVCARMLAAAGLRCGPTTMLSHAEVEQTLGIKQRGKWDITVLPWDPSVKGAKAVGDLFRDLVRREMRLATSAPLKMGNNRPVHVIEQLQTLLTEKGYFTGKIDGLFGKLTRAAVLAFQADHELPITGEVDDATWEMLEAVKPREKRDVSLEDLKDSRIIQKADQVEKGTAVTVGTGVVMTTLENAEEISDTVARTDGIFALMKALAGDLWPVAVFLIFGLAIWFAVKQIKAARLEDAQTGATLKP